MLISLHKKNSIHLDGKMVKRKRGVMASSDSPAPNPKMYIRLQRNSEREWQLFPGPKRVESSEVKSDVPRARASNSPQGAEHATGSSNAWKKRPSSSSGPPQTPTWAPLPGAPANRNGVVQASARSTGPAKLKPILKRSSGSLSQYEDTPPPINKSPEKNVRILPEPEVKFITPVENSPPDRFVSPPPAEDEPEIVALDEDEDDNMTERPKLKLNFGSRASVPQEPASTPSSAVARTPSIKLNFKQTPLPTPSINAEPTDDAPPPTSTTKKRKRTLKALEAERASRVSSPEASPSPPLAFKKPTPIRKLTIKHAAPKPIVPHPSHSQAQTPGHAVQAIKLKYKGKLPRRPIGVGYDSENEESERDPVILEGFVLRMQPGPDAEYIRKAIADGTVGVPRAAGGADIQVRFFDTHGRRGVVVIKQQRWASTLVDLPCVVEGMKSWDRRGWVKGLDVCQMLLVLGKVGSDEEARTYPLPQEVDQRTWGYAHGLTAPMRWVRKRRFERTKRARVDDIEAVERRVRALLDADDAAVSTTYSLHDRDPREDVDMDAGDESGEYDEESGEEASDSEDQTMETPRDYFTNQNGGHGGTVESPQYEEVRDEDIAELEEMFSENEDDSRLPLPQLERVQQGSLQPPEDGSSFAVTSASGSPSAVAQTPDDEEDSGDEDEDE